MSVADALTMALVAVLFLAVIVFMRAVEAAEGAAVPEAEEGEDDA